MEFCVSTSSPTLSVVITDFCQSGPKHVMSLGRYSSLAFCPSWSIWTDGPCQGWRGWRSSPCFTRHCPDDWWGLTPFFCAYRPFRSFVNFLSIPFIFKSIILSSFFLLNHVFFQYSDATCLFVWCVSTYFHSGLCFLLCGDFCFLDIFKRNTVRFSIFSQSLVHFEEIS